MKFKVTKNGGNTILKLGVRKLDATVTPGGYAVVLEDPEGGQTKPLTLTVAK